MEFLQTRNSFNRFKLNCLPVKKNCIEYSHEALAVFTKRNA